MSPGTTPMRLAERWAGGERQGRARALATLALLAGVGTFACERVKLSSRLSLSDLLLLLATLCLLPRLLGEGRDALRSGGPLLAGIGLIGAGGLLGTLAAPNLLGSLSELAGFLLLTSWLVLLTTVWQPTVREIRRLVWSFLGSVALSSLDAIYLDHGDLNGRALGLTTHPNQLAMLCVLATGPATLLVIGSRGRARAAAIAVAGILPLGLLYSGSRAGFFGYLAVLLGVIILSRRREWIVAALAGPLLAALLIASGAVRLPTPNALQRVFGSHNTLVQHSLDYSNIERRELLSVTLARIEHHPLTGEGFEYFSAAHDIYLQLWASAGLLGLAGFGLVTWRTMAPVLGAWRGEVRPAADSPESLLAIGLSLGFGGFLVAGLFQNQLADRFIWLAPSLILALRPLLAEAGARLPARSSPALSTPPGR